MADNLQEAAQLRQEFFGIVSEKLDGEMIGAAYKALNGQYAQYERHLDNSDDTYDKSLFPYLAEGPLPTPIPTVQEICAWQDSSGQSPFNRDVSLHFVRGLVYIHIGPYQVQVSASKRTLQEAENMIYLERNSTVRTAKVYAAFSSDEADPFGFLDHPDNVKGERFPCYYLVMEHLEGEVVGILQKELWENNNPVWNKIVTMLGDELRKLRDVPPEDPNHFGRINGRPAARVIPLAHPDRPDSFDYGPFNYEQVVQRMIHSTKVARAYRGILANKKAFGFSQMHKTLLGSARSVLIDDVKPSDRLPVLSHMRAGLRNFAVAKLVRDKDGKAIDVEYAVWIRWDALTWMPSWHEPGGLIKHVEAEIPDIPCSWRNIYQSLEHIDNIKVPITFYATCLGKGLFT